MGVRICPCLYVFNLLPSDVFFLIEVRLVCDVASVSGVQRSDRVCARRGAGSAASPGDAFLSLGSRREHREVLGPRPPRGPVSSFPAAAACHTRWRLILSAPPSSSVVPLLPSYCAPLASHAPRLQGSFLTAVSPSSVSVAGDGWLSWRVRPVYIRWSYRSGPGEARHFAARVASPPCVSLGRTGRTVSPAFAVVALVCSVLRSDSRRAL